MPPFPPPAAVALCSSVGSDCFPFPLTCAFRDRISSDSWVILPSCCLRSSLLALSSYMTSLRACPCSKRACWFWALWSNCSLPISSSLAIAADPSAWIDRCNWELVAWWHASWSSSLSVTCSKAICSISDNVSIWIIYPSIQDNSVPIYRVPDRISPRVLSSSVANICQACGKAL